MTWIPTRTIGVFGSCSPHDRRHGDARTYRERRARQERGPRSDAFAKLDEAHTKLCHADEQAEQAKAHYVKAVQMDGGSVPAHVDVPAASAPRSAQGSHAIIDGDAYRDVRNMLQRSGAVGVGGVKPLGEAFDRPSFRNALVTGGSSTSGGAFIEADRKLYVDVPGRPTTLLNYITIGETDSDLVEYVRLNARPSSAAFVAEATTVADGSEDGLKPEGSTTFEVKQAAVETVAELVPVTRNAFADAGQLRTVLDQLLRQDLQRAIESGVVNGGASASFQGITEATGINAVTYSASYNIAEQLRRGITQIRLDYEEPDYIAMHPADAERLAFLRTSVYDGTTTDDLGDYILGGPMQGRVPTLWGLPIVESVLVTEGVPFIGTKNAATLWVREGANVLVSDSHKDWFQRNVLALLAEARVAFGVQRPSAFCTVDIAA
jgi:HK97 family phage major capsid protein